MARNLSDIVGHLFPTTQVGSYPRPTWNRFDVRERDFRVAMIGDQLGGLEVRPQVTALMFTFPRPMAQGKLRSMAQAAQTLRDEIGG